MDVDAKITGYKELQAALEKYAKEVPSRLERKFWKWAMRLASDAARHAPVETGTLKASIRGEVVRQGGELVGAYGTNEKHAVFVEFGTRAHTIKPRKKKSLHWKGPGGESHFAKEVQHPGIQIGTPESPRKTWPTKELTHTTTPETMPYHRPAWGRNKDKLIEDLQKIGGEVL